MTTGLVEVQVVRSEYLYFLLCGEEELLKKMPFAFGKRHFFEMGACGQLIF